ncbi:hypothetical protein ACWEOE_10965 [Amycolatopsis sp. NPDC004368]
MNAIGKAIAQLAATVLAAVVPLLIDGSLSNLEVLNLILLAASSALVAVVPNLSAGTAKYAKGIVAVVLAVGTLLTTFLTAGTAIGTGEIIQLVLAALGAVGVIGLPAKQFPAVPVRGLDPLYAEDVNRNVPPKE